MIQMQISIKKTVAVNISPKIALTPWSWSWLVLITSLTCLYDKISSAIDNKEYTVGIFIDLSKAFDHVDRDILLSKLDHYGIRGTALSWFESYLNNRQQYVEFNGHC